MRALPLALVRAMSGVTILPQNALKQQWLHHKSTGSSEIHWSSYSRVFLFFLSISATFCFMKATLLEAPRLLPRCLWNHLGSIQRRILAEVQYVWRKSRVAQEVAFVHHKPCRKWAHRLSCLCHRGGTGDLEAVHHGGDGCWWFWEHVDHDSINSRGLVSRSGHAIR